jgi:predicted anti-sigma-YlaC factor YlaD
MHKPVKERLEEYLRGVKDPSESHLDSCEDCRQQVQVMQDHAALLRLLAAPSQIEPDPGFYARAMEAIEAHRRASVWFAFMDPDFGRRLSLASLVLVLLLGSYLVLTQQGAYLDPSSPVSFMAAEPPGHHVGTDPQRDREMVLLSLASYRE